MADIFISYAREDRNWVRGLAQDLEAEGYSVWWDPNLLPGSRYRETIEKELDQAFASIVVWSSDSIQSDFVRDEAEEARVLNRLVPVLKDAVQPPHGFRQIQTADLSDWRAGRRDHSEFVLVVEGLQALALAQAKGTAKPKALPPPPRKTWAEKLTDTLKTPAGLGGLAAAVLVVVALAYFLGSHGTKTTPPAIPGPGLAPMQQAGNMPPAPPPQQAAPTLDPAQMTDAQKIQTCLDGSIAANTMVAICTDVLNMNTLPPSEIAHAHVGRGRAYSVMREYGSAVTDYTLALDIMPHYEYALVNRGSAYFNMNQFDAAMNDYNAAVAANPQDPNAFGLRADLEARQNNPRGALADYQRAVSLAPANPNGWKGLCLMRAEMNIELEEALANCNRAIQIDGNNGLFYNALGLLQLRRNDNQGTIDAYSRALALQPNVATSLYGRGLAEQRLGNMADAQRDMASARAVQGNIDQVFSGLGIVR